MCVNRLLPDNQNRAMVMYYDPGKFFLFMLLLGTIPVFALGQYTMLSGRISEGDRPLPYAGISLYKTTDKIPKYNTLSDSLGYYQFSAVRQGYYLLKATVVGYKPFCSDTFRIRPDQKQCLLDIHLEVDSNRLQEVTVSSKKLLVETEKDKLIFNVHNVATIAGLTAFDLLKKLPGISTSQNDEILFRGSSGVNVMLDGRMTYLSGAQLSNYLKGISAEDISKVELITAPSSQYDAQGTTGIMNIVARKIVNKSYAIDLRSSVSKGKYWMTDENISGSYHSKKISAYGSFDFKTPDSYFKEISGNTINDSENVTRLYRYNTSEDKINYYAREVGVDWQMLSRHTVGINYTGYSDDFKSYTNSTASQATIQDNSLQSFIQSANNIVEPYHYDAFHLHYKYDIDSFGKRITVNSNCTSYRNYSDGLMTTRNFSKDSSFTGKEQLKTHQPGFINIKSVNADADLPFKKFSVKSGIKYAKIANDNRYRFDSLRNGTFVEVNSLSNRFWYKEKIAAVYLSGSTSFHNMDIEAGVRLEYTGAAGFTDSQSLDYHWKYTKLFPSFSIDQTIDKNNKMNLSVSRRINRPSCADLNPVRWYVDEYFYYSGNPDLVPELAWLYSLTYNLKKKYIFSVNWKSSTNYISRRLMMDGMTIRTQSDNFRNYHRFDFTASIPVGLFEFWDVQFFTDASRTAYPISQITGDKQLSQWSAMFTLQQDISLPRGWKLAVSANWYSSELRGIYRTRPAGYADAGIKKSFFNKKLDATLSINDLFNSNRYKAYSLSNITDYYYDDKPYSRVIGISVKYHFGGRLLGAGIKKTEEQERL